MDSEGTTSAPIDITTDLPHDGAVGTQDDSYYCVGGLTSDDEYLVQLDPTVSGVNLVVYSDPAFSVSACAADSGSAGFRACTGTSTGDTLFIQVDGSATDSGSKFTLDVNGALAGTMAGGSCGGGSLGPGTLTIDLSGAVFADFSFEAWVYDSAGVLVGAIQYVDLGGSLGGITVSPATSDATSFSIDENGDPTLSAGDYTVYIEVDSTGDGDGFFAGDDGYVGTVTIDGDTTLTLDSSDFNTAVEEDITITSTTTALTGQDVICYFVLPGTDLFNDITQIRRITYFGTLTGSAPESSSPVIDFRIASAMAPGDYNLYCVATSNAVVITSVPDPASGDNVFSPSATRTVTGAGQSINGASFVTQ